MYARKVTWSARDLSTHVRRIWLSDGLYQMQASDKTRWWCRVGCYQRLKLKINMTDDVTVEHSRWDIVEMNTFLHDQPTRKGLRQTSSVLSLLEVWMKSCFCANRESCIYWNPVKQNCWTRRCRLRWWQVLPQMLHSRRDNNQPANLYIISLSFMNGQTRGQKTAPRGRKFSIGQQIKSL